jgi:hypothetical protein
VNALFFIQDLTNIADPGYSKLAIWVITILQHDKSPQLPKRGPGTFPRREQSKRKADMGNCMKKARVGGNKRMGCWDWGKLPPEVMGDRHVHCPLVTI